MGFTLVTFHAHPDDESIATAGVMARAATEGHRVVLVVATDGAVGEIADGVLEVGEELAARREKETHAAAEILGVSRVEFLGYRDSGMMGEPTNDDQAAFWQADVGDAAGKLAAILAEERADVLTVYDDHGGYGHPDHIQVHRVGVEAGRLAATQSVLEATMNRDNMRRGIEEARGAGYDPVDPGTDEEFDTTEFGTPEELITTEVDITRFLEAKRAAMAAHASQIPPDSFFLAMPPDFFARAFGTEWFIRRGAPAGTLETDVFAALSSPH